MSPGEVTHPRTNGDENAGSDPPGRNEFGKSGKKPQLFSNHVKTAKKPLFCGAVHIIKR